MADPADGGELRLNGRPFFVQSNSLSRSRASIMSRLPVTPKLKQSHSSNEKVQRKNVAHNAMARKAAAHLNTLIANNPDTTQQYMFADIAYDLGYSTEEVRSGISDGGFNGITFINISSDERRALDGYKSSPIA